MATPSETRSQYGSERLITFSDGVMAVAITLLVLDLKLPEAASQGSLAEALPGLASALWCYALSFVVIGVLWMAHHNQFANIPRVDGGLLWLNLIFLMCVVLIPFVTSLLSGHDGALPTICYAAVLTANCVMLALIWWYARRTPGLMAADVSEQDRSMGLLAPLLVAAVFAGSIGVAYAFGPTAGQWTWLLAAGAGWLANRLTSTDANANLV
ncbi:protein of unknown function DUF1211 [Hyphomicrobium sulfonivorans]|uniref:Integral membrane protein n=1 Tax=Hyphomicrobium sulfonivorans TaxID=121290 RepID=A0A109BID1_HYPSL|nr:TMEM175 family protein [Hyphomicrobium sulfonivorans]KWT69189.1 protein of unknown function DUF1211 [Hyphomicrobium sulfonivorans]